MGSTKSKESPHQLQVLDGHSGSINCICASEDGSIVVTGGEDSLVMLWAPDSETLTTENIGTLQGHESYITCVCSHAEFVLSGSADSMIRKWSMETTQCLYTYEGHTSRVSKILCTGPFIVSSSSDKTARVWLFEHQFARKNEDGFSEPCLHVLKSHTKGVYPIMFVPGSTEEEPNKDASNPAESIHPGDVIVTGSADGNAISWNFQTGNIINTFRSRSTVTCLSYDDVRNILFTSDQRGNVFSWNMHNADCIRALKAHDSSVMSMLVVNNLMYTAGLDGDAKGWVHEYGDCTGVYKATSQGSITCLKFHEGILYIGTTDGIAKAFDTKTEFLRRTFDAHEAAVNHLVIASNMLYTVSDDSTLRAWSIDNIRNTGDTKSTDGSLSARNRNSARSSRAVTPVPQICVDIDNESAQSIGSPGSRKSYNPNALSVA